jgi:preprotein translocase subunit SecE
MKISDGIPISRLCHPSSGIGIMAKANLFKFMQEVRDETQKVTWPTRRETAITTAMVFVMVAIASVFFLLADQFIRILVTTVLGFAG